MKKLMLKDVFLNRRYVVLAIVVSLTATILSGFEDGDFGLLSFYFTLMLPFSLFISKSCYVDERGYTLNFLKTLPTRTANIVNAKYALTLGAVCLSYLLFFVSGHIVAFAGLFPVRIHLIPASVALSVHFLYCGCYLLCFFRFSYSVAQYSNGIILVAMLLGKMIGSRKYLQVDLNDLPRLLLIALVATLTLFLFSWHLSIRAFGKRVS